MDPPLVNEASFTAASNPSSYSLVELLSLPISATFIGEDESTLTDLSGAKRRRSDRNSSDDVSTSENHLLPNESTGKRAKGLGSGEEKKKPEPPKDYIHVRARRGQATDSHSLAERARRERISERMKILQDLVPGCNKVIGKAMVLDEIINYIQSLQGQVEFLSMKLEAVNSRTNHPIEGFPLKDLTTRTFDANQMMFGLQPPKENSQGAQAEWLHMQIGGALERAT